MTLLSNWNTGIFLNWLCDLPYRNRPQTGPAFFIDNIECYFLFCRKTDPGGYGCYYLYLKPKNENIVLRSFSFTIYYNCTYDESTIFFKRQATFCDSKFCVFSFNDGNLKKQILNLEDCVQYRFVFAFERSVGVSLSSETKNDAKSVQTPSYIDNCFLMYDVSQDFSKLLDEDLNHDVEFVCGNQTIKAHKNVLSCRSKVFSSMLHSDMKEGSTGRVNIEDMDTAIFQQFLKCMYTGILPELTLETALQFYNAGDKYDIGALKKQCADYLVDNLSLENACDILVVADRHNDPDFKKRVIEYIMEKRIPHAGGKWIDFCQVNPVLGIEVLNLFCQYLVQK